MNKPLLYVLCGLVALAVAFASGRYSVKPTVVSNVSHVDTKVDDNKVVHNHVVTVQTKDTNGSTVTTTTSDTVTNDKKDETQNSTNKITVDSKRTTLNVSALVGTKLDNFAVPTYGLSVSKELLGPVTVGAWAFSNGIVGVSIGVDF